jgi:hypothetical protein
MKAMRSVLAFIMVAVAVYISGCAVIGNKKVSFKPDIKGRFSARGQPAAVTQMSKAELFDQDYVSLGHLTVEQITEVCKGYSDSKTNEWISKGCKKKSLDAHSTEVLLKRAAERGADLVKLTKDGGIKTEPTFISMCDFYMSVPTQRYVCPPVGGAGCYTKIVYEQRCTRWRKVPSGHLVKRYSSGTIWRLDPVLVQDQEFMFAATSGDTDRIQKVLDDGYDIFTKDSAGETALQRAARYGHVDVINILISRGLPVDVRATDGSTPLMTAAGSGKARAVNALLASGANINAQQPGGDDTGKYTPLMYAIRFGNPASVKAILKAKPDASLKNSQNLDALGIVNKYQGGGLYRGKYALVVPYMKGAYGFINKTGKIVIPPQFIFADAYSDGLARVNVGSSGWGYIDKKGSIVIEPTFFAATVDNLPQKFSEGLAAVKVGKKWGYIDKKGKMVIVPQFIHKDMFEKVIGPFKEGLAREYQKSSDKYGYIDRTGKVVIDYQFKYARDFSEGLATVEVGKKWGYIDRTGKVVIDFQFKYAENFSEGLAAVKVGKKWGYIDKTGTFIIQPRFECKKFLETPGKFSEGRAVIYFGGERYGVIDTKGKIVVKPIYSFIFPFSEGLALVLRNGLVGFIDKKGNEVIKPQFLHGNSFSEGLAKVEHNEKWGFIDKTGKYVIKPIFEDAGKFSEGLARVRVFDESLSYLMK